MVLVEKGRPNALARELPSGCLLLSLMAAKHRSRGEMCSLVSCARLATVKKSAILITTAIQLRIGVLTL